MRIVVYVEGKTELVFVREFLCKWYDYVGSRMGLKCMELRNTEAHDTDYSFGDQNAERHYTIVNVGGDQRALSKALSNAPEHRRRGYQRVLVLRDMYSDGYVNFSKKRVIDPVINEKFIQGAQMSIDKAEMTDFVFCSFAIMEIEAWILGMGWYLEKVDKKLNQMTLLEALEFDLDKDPEVLEFHPAKRLKKIYNHVDLDYDKHEHQINSIMSHLDKQDFEFLLDMEKCSSFNAFVSLLTN